jgi:non-specific serine/threonine protein kinase
MHKQGTKLDYATAVATALADDNPTRQNSSQATPSNTTHTNSAETAQLTEGEQQVALMLGANPGLTNKNLAAQLFVTVGTIEAHMNHIMRKLGVTSRAQIAVWAITHTAQARRATEQG